MDIRTATMQDGDAVNSLYRSAFPQGEREQDSKLALELLTESSSAEILSLVAEAEGAVVGHVAFSPVVVATAVECRVAILAPLAVHPDCQKRHIGTALVEAGIQQLSAMGAGLILVYGDPAYYGRLGFTVDAAENYTPPHPLEYPFGWQALVLDQRMLLPKPVAIECVAPLSVPELW